MSDDEDDFFESPRSTEKIYKAINGENKNNISTDSHEEAESASRKNVKIIEAKIPSVTAVSNSITSDPSDASDSDGEDASKSRDINANAENQQNVTNSPNKKLNNVKSRQNSDKNSDAESQQNDTNSPNKKPNNVKSRLNSDSEDSDDDQTVSPLPVPRERQSKCEAKTTGVKKSSSSSSLTDKSAHSREQAVELKQFLGSIKNYSFSSDKLKAIDKENQRLLEKITLYTSEAKRSRQSLNGNGKPGVRPSSANLSRPSSAAINRRSRQKKIDEENMAMLRRLQQVRPSKELQTLHASRPSSSMSIRSTSMTSLKSGTPKRRGSLQKPEADLTYRLDYTEPITACSLID